MKQTGEYTIGHVLWDGDKALWYCKMGIHSRNGEITIHYTVWGRKPEIAENRAEMLARILTALRPGDLKIKDKSTDKLLDDILNSPED
jgi:hypothetical protein